jgi:hypothetical protein
MAEQILLSAETKAAIEARRSAEFRLSFVEAELADAKRRGAPAADVGDLMAERAFLADALARHRLRILGE